jgi:diguanylate cyclase (GGDEF)-like protein
VSRNRTAPPRAGPILRRDGPHRREEFLLLFPGTPWKVAEEVCERIRGQFESEAFLSEKVFVTVSIGIADFCGDEDERTLLRRADAALYEAKNGGRNLVRSARCRPE